MRRSNGKRETGEKEGLQERKGRQRVKDEWKRKCQ